MGERNCTSALHWICLATTLAAAIENNCFENDKEVLLQTVPDYLGKKR